MRPSGHGRLSLYEIRPSEVQVSGERIMHLHLEVWRGGADSRFDPQRVIETTWEYAFAPAARVEQRA